MSLVPLNAPEWPLNGWVVINANTPCADPESFVRDFSLAMFCLVYEGREDQNPLKAGH